MSAPKSSPGLVAMLLLFVGVAQSQAEWSFTGLGTLGGEQSGASALSADGRVVVGWSEDINGIAKPFRWEDGLMVALGLTPTNPWVASHAADVSADGSVVVGRLLQFAKAFRWEQGAIEWLWDGGGGADSGIASGVSADGSVVVGETTFWEHAGAIGRWKATRWEAPDYQREFLETVSDRSSSAYDVSSDGSVIVGMTSALEEDPYDQAFRWEDGVMVGLGALGGKESAAYAVSADGSVIVGSSEDINGDRRAFRWENGVMDDLGTLGAGNSSAWDISADGSVVVGLFWDSQSNREPFIWDGTHRMRWLTDVLSQGGIDLSDWDLDGAGGISADGTVIVGTGYHISAGRTEGWIATIPEPSTLAGLLSMGGALLLAQLRRRRRRVD